MFLLSVSDFFYDRDWDFAGDLLGTLSDWFGAVLDQYGVLSAFGLQGSSCWSASVIELSTQST